MEFSKDLVAASSIPLILSILQKDASYGYAILKTVAKISNNSLEWSDGMLYPVLHRLENQALIESFWKTANNGRNRKYYKITEQGINHLEEQKEQWQVIYHTLKNNWAK